MGDHSALLMAEIRRAWLLPENALRPVAISKITGAKREDVVTGVGFLAFQLFRRHVLQCSQNGTLVGERPECMRAWRGRLSEPRVDGSASPIDFDSYTRVSSSDAVR